MICPAPFLITVGAKVFGIGSWVVNAALSNTDCPLRGTWLADGWPSAAVVGVASLGIEPHPTHPTASAVKPTADPNRYRLIGGRLSAKCQPSKVRQRVSL